MHTIEMALIFVKFIICLCLLLLLLLLIAVAVVGIVVDDMVLASSLLRPKFFKCELLTYKLMSFATTLVLTPDAVSTSSDDGAFYHILEFYTITNAIYIFSTTFHTLPYQPCSPFLRLSIISLFSIAFQISFCLLPSLAPFPC